MPLISFTDDGQCKVLTVIPNPTTTAGIDVVNNNIVLAYYGYFLNGASLTSVSLSTFHVRILLVVYSIISCALTEQHRSKSKRGAQPVKVLSKTWRAVWHLCEGMATKLLPLFCQQSNIGCPVDWQLCL
jgi:hypothetical protein